LIGETVTKMAIIRLVICWFVGNAEWYVGKPDSYVSTWLWPKASNGYGFNRWQSKTKLRLP